MNKPELINEEIIRIQEIMGVNKKNVLSDNKPKPKPRIFEAASGPGPEIFLELIESLYGSSSKALGAAGKSNVFNRLKANFIELRNVGSIDDMLDAIRNNINLQEAVGRELMSNPSFNAELSLAVKNFIKEQPFMENFLDKVRKFENPVLIDASENLIKNATNLSDDIFKKLKNEVLNEVGEEVTKKTERASILTEKAKLGKTTGEKLTREELGEALDLSSQYGPNGKPFFDISELKTPTMGKILQDWLSFIRQNLGTFKKSMKGVTFEEVLKAKGYNVDRSFWQKALFGKYQPVTNILARILGGALMSKGGLILTGSLTLIAIAGFEVADFLRLSKKKVGGLTSLFGLTDTKIREKIYEYLRNYEENPGAFVGNEFVYIYEDEVNEVKNTNYVNNLIEKEIKVTPKKGKKGTGGDTWYCLLPNEGLLLKGKQWKKFKIKEEWTGDEDSPLIAMENVEETDPNVLPPASGCDEKVEVEKKAEADMYVKPFTTTVKDAANKIYTVTDADGDTENYQVTADCKVKRI